MNDPPKTVYDVHHVRNAGSPNSREAHGDGVLVVVSGWESQLQGKGDQVEPEEHIQAREMRFAG